MHILWFDVFRILSVYAVIVIHLPIMDVSPWVSWVHSAVPMFALLAGYLSVRGGLAHDFSLKTVVRQRAERLLIPYLFWTASYWILNNVCLDCWFSRQMIVWPSFEDWLRILLLGGAGPHLWFLPCLFYGQVLLYFGLWGCRRLRVGTGLFLTGSFFLVLGCCLWLPGKTSESILGYLRIYFFRLFLFLLLEIGRAHV